MKTNQQKLHEDPWASVPAEHPKAFINIISSTFNIYIDNARVRNTDTY